jgi:hypothetical protein
MVLTLNKRYLFSFDADYLWVDHIAGFGHLPGANDAV